MTAEQIEHFARTKPRKISDLLACDGFGIQGYGYYILLLVGQVRANKYGAEIISCVSQFLSSLPPERISPTGKRKRSITASSKGNLFFYKFYSCGSIDEGKATRVKKSSSNGNSFDQIRPLSLSRYQRKSTWSVIHNVNSK